MNKCERCPDEDTDKCRTCSDNPESDNAFLRYLVEHCRGCCTECSPDVRSICNRMTAMAMGYKLKEGFD